MSVDSLAELEDGAMLLQTLQLSRVSFPIGQRLLGSKRNMSLNPIAKQIPQVVEVCCKFIEEHGKGDHKWVKSKKTMIEDGGVFLKWGKKKGHGVKGLGDVTLPPEKARCSS